MLNFDLSVRPQPQQQQPPPQTTSPYKNKVPPGGGNQAQLARSPLPVVTPRAPDVTRCGGKEESSDYGPVSYNMYIDYNEL